MRVIGNILWLVLAGLWLAIGYVLAGLLAFVLIALTVLLRRYAYDGVDLFDDRRGGRFWYSGGWSIPGLAALFAGGATTAVCLATDVWVGPVAQATGFVDLSVPAGMLVAGAIYAVLLRTPLAKEGRP